jgi:hypothetical protein
MTKHAILFLKLCLLVLLALLHASAWAICTKTNVSQTEDFNSAKITFGKINLIDTYFAPVGTLIATTVTPPTNYTTGGASGASVLWECDRADLASIYFLVATNGDDRVGGYYDIGANDNLTNVYATWFAYVGIKQSMSGITLTRNWQKIPVTTYATVGSKIQIRLQDIPPLQSELYRVSTLPGLAALSSYCGNNNNNGSGIVFATPSGELYTCTQPNAYIQLSGPAAIIPFGHDEAGQDSATSFKFWLADNGFGYGMRDANKLYNNPTCAVRNATPLVLLPTISVRDLDAGMASSANFNVQLECNNTVVSGLNDTQVALGFQVSEGAYSAAQSLNLVNASGGVRALVSDNYNAPEMAKGVGITIANSASPGQPMTFLGQSTNVPLSPTPAGNNAGWYPVLAGATSNGSSYPGFSNYSLSFIASLQKLPGMTVTAGRVHATAYVIVKMQ